MVFFRHACCSFVMGAVSLVAQFLLMRRRLSRATWVVCMCKIAWLRLAIIRVDMN